MAKLTNGIKTAQQVLLSYSCMHEVSEHERVAQSDGRVQL